jgi:uncharacterized protein (DUF1330 family)
MTKGYWIVRLDILDQARYEAYRALNGEAFRKYGGRFLVRGGKFENTTGEARSRNVVLEFPSYQAALDCYRSPEYKRALDARADSVVIDTVIIEGYDGPQP